MPFRSTNAGPPRRQISAYRDFGHTAAPQLSCEERGAYRDSGRNRTGISSTPGLREVPGFRAHRYRDAGHNRTGKRGTGVPGFGAQTSASVPGFRPQGGEITARKRYRSARVTLFLKTCQ